MKARILTIAAALAVGLPFAAHSRTKVACIGNSITYGMTLPDREHTSYPAVLQQKLGDDFEVGNFGRNGATLLRKGHNPYWKTDEFRRAIEFKPDVAVIHLGTNDTDPRNWPNYGNEFVTDYVWLLDTLRAVNPDVRIVIANMAPIGTAHARFKSGTRQWRDEIRKRITSVAESQGLELIDFRTPLVDRQNLVPDNLHPNPEGAALLADYVYGALTGNWGGLKLPEVISDGMVLPHGRWFTLRGRDDAGKTVTLTVDGRKYSTVADNCGDWAVRIDPLKAGGPYTVTVADGDTTVTLNDVMAGEVWLASGQSNMEFRLREASDRPASLSPDSLLRVFRMTDRRRPDAGAFDSLSLAKIDRLDYYLPARWAQPDPEFSAVAWNFGRMLADSLRMPVGIISNPVGGAGIESFIDIETLQQSRPEVLLNWETNDYVQPWVRGRAIENMGGQRTGHRHAYEPSYLFSAGVRSLAGYPINGVVWYQGESNAHNVELHEELFGLFLESWRKEFDNPSLPFVITQLSSIERPSWPEFRDSQRRLADDNEGVYMAVSSDLGDPYDVHPKRKGPVGRRLARQALHNLYGFANVTPAGPSPVRAEAWPDGSIRLIMANADGMTTADGQPLLTFEIAETEGLYAPAEVEISHLSDTIILRNTSMKNPRFARYGWQPFTKANLINSDSIPASTFRVEAVEVEPGLEHGVSAAFGGTVAGVPVIAGGCNFPYADPLAAGIAKVYYKGIYRATDGKRIGSLPEPTAYGASASTPLGLAMIGGEGRKTALLLNLDADGNAIITSLPELPAVVDNAYAAAVGTCVYVAGGNVDGTPSNALYSIDLADPMSGWTRHADFPGNPRVQPVMAAGPDGLLYLWGGFAGRHNGKEPSLQCDGLRFNPADSSWAMLPAPTVGRNKISLGGGVAQTIGNKIVCTGGVNREIFLNALRKQPADYLQHPVEWYRFNGYVCTYDTESGRWVIGERSPEYARAGAATALIDGGKTMLLMGGELKPRIRTPRFTPVK